MKSVAIIGGGACGLLLANLIKDDYKVTILEKNSKLGKKILASGNGKCNFTNVGDYKNKYNNEFADTIISEHDNEETRNYFSSLGLAYRVDEENRAYPLSESSVTVLNLLKKNLKNVRILLDSKVSKLENVNDQIRVYYGKTSELFDYVVCASGSNASNLGSDYAYNYLKDYGVEFSEIRPSLTPLRVKENIKELDGVRVKCNVTLYKDNKKTYSEHGEVLFKDDALSGIVIYNMSSIINRDYNHTYELSLDLLSDSYNETNNKDIELLVHPKLVNYVKNPKDLRFAVTGLYPSDCAQVISGGVSLKEVNSDLSYKKNPHIYFGGELLDIDGVCGGFNLQFAFSCAFAIRDSLSK